MYGKIISFNKDFDSGWFIAGTLCWTLPIVSGIFYIKTFQEFLCSYLQVIIICWQVLLWWFCFDINDSDWFVLGLVQTLILRSKENKIFRYIINQSHEDENRANSRLPQTLASAKNNHIVFHVTFMVIHEIFMFFFLTLTCHVMGLLYYVPFNYTHWKTWQQNLLLPASSPYTKHIIFYAFRVRTWTESYVWPMVESSFDHGLTISWVRMPGIGR